MLVETAERLGCPLIVYGQDFLAYEENGRMIYQDETGLMDLTPPRLPGRHQYANAAAAIAAVKAAGFDAQPSRRRPRDDERRLAGPHAAAAARASLSNWRRAGAEIWLDGGHNPGAGIVVAEALAEQEERFARPLFLICGMINTKDQTGYFRAFKGMARHVFTVPVSSSEAGVPNAELASAGDDGRPFGRAGQFGRQRADAAARHLGSRRNPAAHPDRRLALPRRRSAGGERHAAGLEHFAAEWSHLASA